VIVAVFGDVHANLLALEVFLERVEPVADAYLCLGDVVNYGPWNDECLARIVGLPGVTVLEGNHERLFLGEEPIEDEIPLVQAFYASSKTSFTRADLITELPGSTQLGPFTCVHTLEGRRIFADSEITVERDHVIGHSHYQYEITRNGHRIVNPGSLGQNRDRIDHVDYALYDTERAQFAFFSVPYAFDRYLTELRAREYPAMCLEYYERKLAEARAR
jgi:predicted phosphodiesterase